jgi:hypothetical protein
MPEIRLRRQVRMVFRKGGERSHAAAAFLESMEKPERKASAAGPRAPAPED